MYTIICQIFILYFLYEGYVVRFCGYKKMNKMNVTPTAMELMGLWDSRQ